MGIELKIIKTFFSWELKIFIEKKTLSVCNSTLFQFNTLRVFVARKKKP